VFEHEHAQIGQLTELCRECGQFVAAQIERVQIGQLSHARRQGSELVVAQI
jgi:uncharacterized protein YlaI